jgi:hypothetical protein
MKDDIKLENNGKTVEARYIDKEIDRRAEWFIYVDNVKVGKLQTDDEKQVENFLEFLLAKELNSLDDIYR